MKILLKINRRLKRERKSVLEAIAMRRAKRFLNTNYSIAQNPLYDDKDDTLLIVFSKDRALQVHALIESYFRKVKESKPLNILYACSSPHHENSYNDLIAHYSNNDDVNFLRENNFRMDLIGLVRTTDCKKIFLCVDDVIFSKAFSMNNFCKINPKLFSPSLYKGLDLTYCSTHGIDQALPGFINISKDSFFVDIIVWKWDDALQSPDWTYPLGVSVHLYDRRELLFMIRNTEFKAPNSLEANLQKWMPFFVGRYGISYKYAKIGFTPINLVNTEVENLTSNQYSADDLLDKWNKGYRIRYEDFDDLDVNESSLHKISFVKR